MRDHGTPTRYRQGCRCLICCEFAKLRTRALDNAVGKVGQDFPAIGALVRLGWTRAA